MKKSGSQVASNPFIISMEISLQIALSIIYYHWTRLDTHKTDGTWQLDMFNDFDVPAQKFFTLMGLKFGDLNMRISLTSVFESSFKDMSIKLDEIDDLIRKVHPVNSADYKFIWGPNRNRFYNGNYMARLAELLAFANVMTAKSVPLGATAAEAYHTEITNNHNEQQGMADKVKTDAAEVEKTRQELICKLYKNMGGLIYHYGDQNNCQAIVQNYFPLNLIGDRSKKGHYQLIVPKAEHRRVAMHDWKPGEKIEGEAKGADAWVCTADDAEHHIYAGYKFVKDNKVTINPEQIGDITKKLILASNPDPENSCDLIFNIVKG